MSTSSLVRLRRAAPAVDTALAVAVAVAVFILLWPFLNPELEAIRGKVTYPPSPARHAWLGRPSPSAEPHPGAHSSTIAVSRETS